MHGQVYSCRQLSEWLSGVCLVQGTIPDMTSTTHMYLQLQRAYRRKAEADAAAVKAHAQALLTSIGRNPQSISTAAISGFVKNARNLRSALPFCQAEAAMQDGTPSSTCNAVVISGVQRTWQCIKSGCKRHMHRCRQSSLLCGALLS